MRQYSRDILSTAIAAIDHDFAVTVVKDACLDEKPEVHEFLVKNEFLRSGGVKVISTQDANSALSKLIIEK